MNDLDDRAWVLAAVERYEASLVRLAASITRDVDAARDVVQDCFLQLCRQRRQDVETHLGPWLFTVCRHRALDVARKESRMKPTEEALETADAEPGPLDALAAHDARLASTGVWDSLRTLPARQREVVLLRFRDGLSYRDVAAAMDTTVNNVGVLLHTALKALRGKPALRRLQPES